MKRIVCIILSFVTLFLCLSIFSSCGNKALGFDFGNFTFNKIHCVQEHKCLTIEKWHENDRGIEVVTKEAGSMFFSEGTYVLIEDRCPYCGN